MLSLSNKQRRGMVRSLLCAFGAAITVVDLYCGAGGASAGLFRAAQAMNLPIPKLLAINHWDTAIATHSENFPDAVHILSGVECVDPRTQIPRGIVDFLLAGPSCTHHSRARGGKPTTDQQRSGAWEIIRWCRDLIVRHVLVENVPEFMTWGPLREKRDKKTGEVMLGKDGEPLMEPDPTLRDEKTGEGLYFQQWVRMLRDMGYKVEWKILCSADFGDATTRKRLFIQARLDGKPIVWPLPTHQAPDKKTGKVNQTSMSFGHVGDPVKAIRPWKTAREIINWNTASRSIFNRSQPLAWKTLLRIAAGLLKFWGIEIELDTLYPYSKEGTKAGAKREGVRATMINRPTPKDQAVGFTIGQQSCAAPRSSEEPVATVAAAGAISLVQPILLPPEGIHRGNVARSIDDPIPTVTSRGAGSIIEPFLVQYTQTSNGNGIRQLSQPVPTVTTKTEHGIVEAFIVPNNSSSPPVSVANPIHTVTTNARGIGLAEPHLIVLRHSGAKSGMAAPRSIDEPVPTLCASGEHIALCEPVIKPYIARFNGGRDSSDRTESVDTPLSTLDTSNRLGVVEPILIGVGGPTGKQAPASVDEPFRTLLAENHTGVAEAHLMPCVVSYHGNDDAHGIEEPLHTIRTKDRFGLLEAETASTTATTGDAPVYYLLDIKFRMLSWQELAAAHSFITDQYSYSFAGNRGECVKQVGNSWTVGLATELCKTILHQLTGVLYA